MSHFLRKTRIFAVDLQNLQYCVKEAASLQIQEGSVQYILYNSIEHNLYYASIIPYSRFQGKHPSPKIDILNRN
jgi:hypothetical protein